MNLTPTKQQNLNTIQVKRPITDLVENLKKGYTAKVKKEDPKPAKKKYRYPTTKEEFNVLDAIFNQEFSSELTAHEKNSCKILAQYLTGGVAHHDVYEMACNRIKIDEDRLCKYLIGWPEYDEALRNRWRKGAAHYLNIRQEENANMKELFSRQAHHLNALDEKTAEVVLDMEDTEMLVAVANELRTYFKPADTLDDKYLMTCKQACVNIAQFTKGNLYLEPQEMKKALEARGFVKSDCNRYFIQLVK